MIRILWLGLLILSGSWMFLTPVFIRPSWTGLLPLMAGATLNIISLRKIRVSPFDKKYLLISIPLFISAWIIPFPYNLGLIFLLVGLVMIIIPSLDQLSGIGVGLIFTGLILIIQSAFFPLYFSLASRYHSLDAISPAVCWLMKAVGLNANWYQNIVFIRSDKEIFDFAITMEKLGILFWLNLLLGAILIIFLFVPRYKDRWLAFVLSTSLVYLILRCTGIILLYFNWKKIGLFWNPWVNILSFVPLGLLYLKFLPLKRELASSTLTLSPISLTKNRLILASASFVFAFMLVGAIGFQDPGTTKKGRILIDEKHSNWEWTTRKYDTRWYGEMSGYNYYCLVDYLHYFYRIDRNFELITQKLLDDCDILIIKTPTSRFSSEEIENIRIFVKKGGGLFLIGDHTNVFGTSSYLNPLAQIFGLYFNHDATYDLETGNLSVYERPRLLPHPVIQRLPPFLFATSCTLCAPISAEKVIIGYGLKSVYADYSKKNFFNPEMESPSMNFGLFIQQAAVKYGKGRILAFTDSTVFSNFWMFIPGKPELLLGSINWLNRNNRFHHLNLVFIFISLSALVISLLLFLKTKQIQDFLIIFSSFLLAFSLSVLAFQKVNQITYPQPQQHKKFVRICFDTEHSNFELPILKLVNDSIKSYHIFYVWTQRLGYIPQVSYRFREALKSNITIIINPIKPFTKREIENALIYTHQGGIIIMLDNRNNQKSSANQILHAFDMAIDYSQIENSVIYDAEQKMIAFTQNAGSIQGGKPLLFTEDKHPVLSINHCGTGSIIVMADSSLFSDTSLGSMSTVPNEQQLRLYELEFWMLGQLIQMPGGDADYENLKKER